jgi:glycerol-3-phosphate dehydrogenase
MRSRDLDRLAATTYDVLVVGGGIHGLAIAYEAASRGLRTALVDAGDYGGAASFNHQKTAHGGLRSLQSGRIDRARQSIFERRALARIAPWLLRPLPFITGTYRSFIRNRLALRAAFKFDEWLGRHRNAGVEPELHLPAPRLISKAATLRLFPGIKQDGLTGAAQWYDYQMVEAERLTFAFAAAADRAGADLANYVEATGPLKAGGRIAGMQVRDRLSSNTFEIRAQVTVNAAGAHAGTVMAAFGVKRDFPLLKAMNLVTSKRASDIALASPSPSGRMLTFVPWRGRALIGTSQSSSLVQPDAVSVSAAEVDAFVREANAAFPALQITPADVTLVHRGAVPAAAGRNGAVDLRPEPAILDHSREGAAGAVTVIGVKYTTARAIGERAVSAIARHLGKRLPASRTAIATLPGAAIADHEALAIETGRDLALEAPLPVIRHLIAKYGEGAADIIRLTHAHPELQAPLAPGVPTLGAEVVHVIQHEQAMRLTDIVIRRTALGSMDPPGEEALRSAAALAGAELGWDQQRVASEIDAVRDFYRLTAP